MTSPLKYISLLLTGGLIYFSFIAKSTCTSGAGNLHPKKTPANTRANHTGLQQFLFFNDVLTVLIPALKYDKL